MPGIIGGVIGRVRQGAESMWSSVTEARLEVAAKRKKFFRKMKDSKSSEQESMFGFGIIPKDLFGSDKNPPGLVADSDAANAAIPTDDRWGLIG